MQDVFALLRNLTAETGAQTVKYTSLFKLDVEIFFSRTCARRYKQGHIYMKAFWHTLNTDQQQQLENEMMDVRPGAP